MSCSSRLPGTLTLSRRCVSSIAPCVALIGTVFVLAGCRAREGYQGGPDGERDVLASYSFGNLRADLSSQVQVLTVAAAAESALRSRGYVISSSTATADDARVEAKKSGDWDWDKAVVESWATADGTALRVKIEPFGDEGISRAIMDGVLARLGR